MTMYICCKCGNFIDEIKDINYIESGTDMRFYWCNDCVSKHLNSRGVNK